MTARAHGRNGPYGPYVPHPATRRRLCNIFSHRQGAGAALTFAALLRATVFAIGALSAPLAAAGSWQDYRLIGLDQKVRVLSAQRGQWVVLNFWATWCPPCLREMPELQRFHERHANGNAVVWGITFEDTPRETVQTIIDQLGVTYPILGRGQQPFTPFGEVTGLPTTFIVNPDGNFHRVIRGPVTATELEGLISVSE